MRLSCITLFLYLYLTIYNPTVYASSNRERKVVDLELIGAQRTEINWIKTYLNLQTPSHISENDLRNIERKLLTTAVFTKAKAILRPSNKDPDAYILEVKIEEKWTTIPVIRGAFGGGTPLGVLGIYDTHSFGHLWTLGGELRKYGDASPGGVIWARAPRWKQGKHVTGYELWQDNRIRDIYDSSQKRTGLYKSKARTLRAIYIAPFKNTKRKVRTDTWQYGLDIRITSLKEAKYEPLNAGTDIKDSPLKNVKISHKDQTTNKFSIKLIYDDIIVNNINMDGIRFNSSFGALIDSENAYSSYDLQLFYYRLFPKDLNFAFHSFLGYSTSSWLKDQYFLGGFDSIRGMPDGAIFGSKAFYSNVEMRKITLKFANLWIQNAIFFDFGTVQNDLKEINYNTRSSMGIGIRFIIPQIYRMVFRFDYAWSLNKNSTSGLNAGMNQFFQPYKPL